MPKKKKAVRKVYRAPWKWPRPKPKKKRKLLRAVKKKQYKTRTYV